MYRQTRHSSLKVCESLNLFLIQEFLLVVNSKFLKHIFFDVSLHTAH